MVLVKVSIVSLLKEEIKLCCQFPGAITPDLFVVRNRMCCEMGKPLCFEIYACVWKGAILAVQRNWCAESPPQRCTGVSSTFAMIVDPSVLLYCCSARRFLEL